MSNPQYQNNEGYDDQRPRVHKGFDKYSKPFSQWTYEDATDLEWKYTPDTDRRVTEEILRRQAEEIRAEVARLAPHWARYEAERGHITTEGKRKMADLNWRYEQAANLHLMSEEFYQRTTPRWKKFTNWLRNLFRL